MTWKNPRPEDYSPQALRAIFRSLEDYFKAPVFPNGIQVGDGTGPTYSNATGVTTPAVAVDVDANDIAALNTALDDFEALLPITETNIANDAITTPKIAANAVTADELAAINIGVGKFIASTSYVAGVSGWAIDAGGTAEFNDVIIRGELAAGLVTGDLTLNGGSFFTNPTAPRIEITNLLADTIRWITAGSAASGTPGPVVVGQDNTHPTSGLQVTNLFTSSGIRAAGQSPATTRAYSSETTTPSPSIYEIAAGQIKLDGSVLVNNVPAMPVPHTEVRRVTGAGGVITSTASFTNMPVDMVTTSFVKVRTDSKLVVEFMGGVYNNNALGGWEISARFGGTDYAMSGGFGTQSHGGAREISGIAAGTFDVTIRARVTNATGSAVQVAQLMGMKVTETY